MTPYMAFDCRFAGCGDPGCALNNGQPERCLDYLRPVTVCWTGMGERLPFGRRPMQSVCGHPVTLCRRPGWPGGPSSKPSLYICQVSTVRPESDRALNASDARPPLAHSARPALPAHWSPSPMRIYSPQSPAAATDSSPSWARLLPARTAVFRAYNSLRSPPRALSTGLAHQSSP